jgi:hypothetical protein
VTTPDGSRGGTLPPRPPAGKPQQWFVLRPMGVRRHPGGRAAARHTAPARADPGRRLARAYGLARDPGGGRHAISLIGPGPDFSPEYAMTTDPGEPVILATLAGAGGELAPLLIDGYALPVNVRLHGEHVTWHSPGGPSRQTLAMRDGCDVSLAPRGGE